MLGVARTSRKERRSRELHTRNDARKYVGHPVDENVEQLEQGLASFRYFGPHALDSWMRCHYEQAQERARKAKLGVWAN